MEKRYHKAYEAALERRAIYRRLTARRNGRHLPRAMPHGILCAVEAIFRPEHLAADRTDGGLNMQTKRVWTYWIIGALLTAAMFITLKYVTNFRFENSDDVVMVKAFMGFEGGQPANFSLYLHTLLTWALYAVSLCVPNVPWFSVFQVALLMFSCVVLAKSIFQLARDTRRPLITGALASVFSLAVFAAFLSCRINFTTTATLAGAAAVLQTMTVDFDTPDKSKLVRALLPALLLLVASYCLRALAALPSLLFVCAVLLWRLLPHAGETKRSSIPWRAVLKTTLVFAAVLAACSPSGRLRSACAGWADTWTGTTPTARCWTIPILKPMPNPPSPRAAVCPRPRSSWCSSGISWTAVSTRRRCGPWRTPTAKRKTADGPRLMSFFTGNARYPVSCRHYGAAVRTVPAQAAPEIVGRAAYIACIPDRRVCAAFLSCRARPPAVPRGGQRADPLRGAQPRLCPVWLERRCAARGLARCRHCAVGARGRGGAGQPAPHIPGNRRRAGHRIGASGRRTWKPMRWKIRSCWSCVPRTCCGTRGCCRM